MYRASALIGFFEFTLILWLLYSDERRFMGHYDTQTRMIPGFKRWQTRNRWERSDPYRNDVHDLHDYSFEMVFNRMSEIVNTSREKERTTSLVGGAIHNR